MEVAKSRQQIAKLEVSELEHRQVEEKIKHVDDALRAICAVNEPITRQKDRDKLLKGFCNNLIGTRGL
jgi:hypothetical protein